MDVIRLDKVGNLDCWLAVETTLAARFPCEWAPRSARPGARGFQKGCRVTMNEDRGRGPCPGGPLNMHMSLKSEGTLPTLPAHLPRIPDSTSATQAPLPCNVLLASHAIRQKIAWRG